MANLGPFPLHCDQCGVDITEQQYGCCSQECRDARDVKRALRPSRGDRVSELLAERGPKLTADTAGEILRILQDEGYDIGHLGHLGKIARLRKIQK